MCTDEDTQVRPVHRSREWQEEKRREQKERGRKECFKGGTKGASAPLFVFPTRTKLTEDLKKVCAEHEQVFRMKVSVRERAGEPVARDAKAEPLRRTGCGREDCFICKNEKGGNCEKNGVGYEIICKDCEEDNLRALYQGETGRNGYSRGKEHSMGLKNKATENPLWKHCQVQHNGQEVSFVMRITGQHRTCLELQVNEAVRITGMGADIILNSKTEWPQAPMVRVVPTTGLHDEQIGARRRTQP